MKKSSEGLPQSYAQLNPEELFYEDKKAYFQLRKDFLGAVAELSLRDGLDIHDAHAEYVDRDQGVYVALSDWDSRPLIAARMAIHPWLARKESPNQFKRRVGVDIIGLGDLAEARLNGNPTVSCVHLGSDIGFNAYRHHVRTDNPLFSALDRPDQEQVVVGGMQQAIASLRQLSPGDLVIDSVGTTATEQQIEERCLEILSSGVEAISSSLTGETLTGPDGIWIQETQADTSITALACVGRDEFDSGNGLTSIWLQEIIQGKPPFIISTYYRHYTYKDRLPLFEKVVRTYPYSDLENLTTSSSNGEVVSAYRVMSHTANGKIDKILYGGDITLDECGVLMNRLQAMRQIDKPRWSV